MKVLIFTGFGMPACTAKMKEIMAENNFPINRVGKIIKYVEDNAIDATGKDIFEFKKTLNNHLEMIGFIDEYYNRTYMVGIGRDEIETFSIVDVDISRPWTIEEYDGSEYIKYLDEYVLVKELNYYKPKE